MVPSVASTKRDRHGQGQVVAGSVRTMLVRLDVDGDEQVAGRAAIARRACPCRVTRTMREPSRIPAGMRTVMVRVWVVVPEPRHSGHGSSMSWPVPRQSRHGWLKPKAPWLSDVTAPEPPQVGTAHAVWNPDARRCRRTPVADAGRRQPQRQRRALAPLRSKSEASSSALTRPVLALRAGTARRSGGADLSAIALEFESEQPVEQIVEVRCHPRSRPRRRTGRTCRTSVDPPDRLEPTVRRRCRIRARSRSAHRPTNSERASSYSLRFAVSDRTS